MLQSLIMTDTAHRRSIRLKGYDYTQPGAYFVTLLAWQRQCLFGEVAGDEVRLKDAGKVLEYYWNTLPAHFSVEIDQWVIMPNHFHGIIWLIDDPVRAKQPGFDFSSIDLHPSGRSPLPNLELRAEDNHRLQPKSLGSLIAGFKAACTTRINRLRRTTGLHVWHRNYHDHIIRNEDELNNIRLYVLDNPRQWVEDEHNPQI
jgi:putative transposase